MIRAGRGRVLFPSLGELYTVKVKESTQNGTINKRITAKIVKEKRHR